jgi:hypothetical protein
MRVSGFTMGWIAVRIGDRLKVLRSLQKRSNLTQPVNYETYFEPFSSTTPVENFKGTVLPAGDTRA